MSMNSIPALVLNKKNKKNKKKKKKKGAQEGQTWTWTLYPNQALDLIEMLWYKF